MTSTLTPLIRDFLEWLDAKPRTYAQVMDAWRTSCPRLTVWEDANDLGLVTEVCVNGREPMVVLTPSGSEFLAAQKRPAKTHG